MNKTFDYRKKTEQAAMIAAIVYPITAVPQALKIYITMDASSLSLLSWIGFAILELVFFVYGLAHGLKPIIITGVLWIFLYTFIIAGIVKYG